MPVNNNYEIMLYKGNSTGRIFNFPFRCFSLDDLVVEYINEEGVKRKLEQNSEYSVQGGLDNSGGMVTYPLESHISALNENEAICIYRQTPLAQEVDFPTYQQAVENALDRGVMLLQEVDHVSNTAVDKIVGFELSVNEFSNRVSVVENLALESSVKAKDAHDTAEQMQIAVSIAQMAAEEAASTAENALVTAEDSTHAHTNKFVLDLLEEGQGGIIYDGVGLALTSGSNIGVDEYRSLLGVDTAETEITTNKNNITVVNGELASLNDKVEAVEQLAAAMGSNVVTLDSRVALLETTNVGGSAIAPQTIVKGAVGSNPAGWEECDCDKPAQHLVDGTTEVTIKAGLQVCAGDSGASLLSETLSSDISVDVSGLADGTHYIYADLDSDGSYKEFGSINVEPQVGLSDAIPRGEILNPQDSNWVGSGLSWRNGDWVCVADSVYSSQYPSRASDGCTSTTNHWENGASMPTWIYIGNTSKAQLITKVNLYPYTDNVNNPKNFIIQGSNDRLSWDDLLSVTNASWEINIANVYTLPENSIYKYIRIYITANTGSSYTLISEIQLIGQGYSEDFYNTSNQTHYDKAGNILRRVYLGEVDVNLGAIAKVINYQHGTTVTLPVNAGANVGVNSIYYLDRPFLGYCTGFARIYTQSKWGNTGWLFASSTGGHGVAANFTEGKLSVQTGVYRLSGSAHGAGGEFSTSPTSAPAKVTVQRGY